jgi:hypothetical protein
MRFRLRGDSRRSRWFASENVSCRLGLPSSTPKLTCCSRADTWDSPRHGSSGFDDSVAQGFSPVMLFKRFDAEAAHAVSRAGRSADLQVGRVASEPHFLPRTSSTTRETHLSARCRRRSRSWGFAVASRISRLPMRFRLRGDSRRSRWFASENVSRRLGRPSSASKPTSGSRANTESNIEVPGEWFISQGATSIARRAVYAIIVRTRP